MPRLECAAQGTPEWTAARRGCFTASRARDAMKRLKSGAWSDERRSYAIELVAERMAGIATDHFVTAAMQWGIDMEPQACAMYEERTGNLCEKTGFWLHSGIEYFGASPDRLVGADGLIEVKCPTTKTFVRWLAEGGIPAEHKPQMLHQLVVLGREWCDFVAYDPRIQIGAPIIVHRYMPTDDERAQYLADASEFLAEVEAMFDKVTTSGE